MSNLHSWVRPMKNISPEEVYRCSWKEAVNWKLVWIVMCWSEPLVKHQIPVFDLRVDRTCFHVPENQWLEVGRWISYWHSPFFRWHVCFWGVCFLSSKRYILPISAPSFFWKHVYSCFSTYFAFFFGSSSAPAINGILPNNGDTMRIRCKQTFECMPFVHCTSQKTALLSIPMCYTGFLIGILWMNDHHAHISPRKKLGSFGMPEKYHQQPKGSISLLSN